MKKLQILLFLFTGFILNAQEQKVNEEWLLILSGFETKEDALIKQKDFNYFTIVLNSAEFDNLNPGWFINCIPFNTRESAIKRSDELSAQGVNNYVKYSGRYINRENYLIENHYVLLNSKYVVLDNIDSSNIDSIIGIDGVGITYIACASVKNEMIPDQFRYLKGKEFVVYNQAGQSTIASVKRFLVVNVENPYWGFTQQWQINKTPSKDIATELFEGKKKLTLVAELEIKSDFAGRMCHLQISNDYKFAGFSVGKNEDVENKAIQKFKSLASYSTHLDSIKASISKGAYDYSDDIPVEINTKLFETANSKYVYVNIHFGDYCDNMLYGHYYANICGIYHFNNDTYEVLEFANHFNFTPIFLDNNEISLNGFIEEIYNGVGTYLKVDEWKLQEHFYIGTLECD